MKKTRVFSFMILGLIVFSGISPIYAEVTEITLDSLSYAKGEKIKVSGTVEEESSGLVSIVIRDPNNKFVLLSQALIQPDNTFEKAIDTNKKFQIFGTYNTTAFVLNMTAGNTVSFDFREKNEPELISKVTEESNHAEENKDSAVDSNQVQIIEHKESEAKLADFVDPQKESQDYIDRYNNEIKYKEWFDRNYPDLTIQEAVGYEITETVNETTEIPDILENKIIPKAEASSNRVSSTNSDIINNQELSQMILAIAGLGILFGAVYGIKIKVDNNSKQISINKEKIKEKINSIIYNDPLDIIKNRLAKGEITLEEYTHLKEALEKKSTRNS